MRRFLPNIGPIHNPEFDIDISSIKLTDYGNIELIEDKTLENLQKKLINRSNKVLQNKSVPFVIGGSKDVNYGCLSALNTFNNNDQNRIGIISIQKFCDFSTYQKVELNSTNGILTFMTENPNIDINIMYFATEKYDNQIETNKFKHDYKNNLSFLHYEEIKKVSNEIKENMELPSTKGGTAFVEKLQEFSKRCDKIHLSVSLEALNVY